MSDEKPITIKTPGIVLVDDDNVSVQGFHFEGGPKHVTEESWPRLSIGMKKAALEWAISRLQESLTDIKPDNLVAAIPNDEDKHEHDN